MSQSFDYRVWPVYFYRSYYSMDTSFRPSYFMFLFIMFSFFSSFLELYSQIRLYCFVWKLQILAFFFYLCLTYRDSWCLFSFLMGETWSPRHLLNSSLDRRSRSERLGRSEAARIAEEAGPGRSQSPAGGRAPRAAVHPTACLAHLSFETISSSCPCGPNFRTPPTSLESFLISS